MNQPQQARCEYVAELLGPRTVRVGEWFVETLPYVTSNRHFTESEMIEYAQPVFMVYSRKESIEPLWVDQQRSPRYERFIIIVDHPAGVPDYGGVRIFVGHLNTDHRIFFSAQHRRCGPKLIYVKPLNIIVKEEHPGPPARAADQQAEVAFTAYIESAW